MEFVDGICGPGWRARASLLAGLTVGAAAAVTALPSHAVSLGQIDSFSAGSSNAWVTGAASSVPPVVVTSGGPTGAGDGYLLATSLGGGGPGSRLVVFNQAQWLGDFLAAGITSIAMDLNNLGSTALSVHLQFNSGVGTATTAGVSLPAGSGWQHVSFSLAAAGLTGTPAALAEVTELRLFHGSNTAPVAIAAQLGIDNIAAVPEPHAAALLLGGLLGLAFKTCRSKKHPAGG